MRASGIHYRSMSLVSLSEVLRRSLRWMEGIARAFEHRQCFSHAASLTFTTLFAAVPFTAVVYIVLSALPGFDGLTTVLRGFVFENFVPESAGRIEGALVEFTAQARNLTFLGVLLLIVSIIMLLMSFEHAFNHVWGVTEARRGAVRLGRVNTMPADAVVACARAEKAHSHAPKCSLRLLLRRQPFGPAASTCIVLTRPSRLLERRHSGTAACRLGISRKFVCRHPADLARSGGCADAITVRRLSARSLQFCRLFAALLRSAELPRESAPRTRRCC